jgi:hypothetical protein
VCCCLTSDLCYCIQHEMSGFDLLICRLMTSGVGKKLNDNKTFNILVGEITTN